MRGPRRGHRWRRRAAANVRHPAPFAECPRTVPTGSFAAARFGGRMSLQGRKDQFAASGSSRWPGIVAEWLPVRGPCRQRRSGSEVHLTTARGTGQRQVSAPADIRRLNPSDRNQSVPVTRSLTSDVSKWPSTAHHDGQVAGCFSPQCALRHPGPRSWPTQVDPERHGTPATAALHDDTARAARAAIRSSFMLSTYSLLSTSCSSTRSMKARARAGCALRLKPCFAASDDGCRRCSTSTGPSSMRDHTGYRRVIDRDGTGSIKKATL